MPVEIIVKAKTEPQCPTRHKTLVPLRITEIRPDRLRDYDRKNPSEVSTHLQVGDIIVTGFILSHRPDLLGLILLGIEYNYREGAMILMVAHPSLPRQTPLLGPIPRQRINRCYVCHGPIAITGRVDSTTYIRDLGKGKTADVCSEGCMLAELPATNMGELLATIYKNLCIPQRMFEAHGDDGSKDAAPEFIEKKVKPNPQEICTTSRTGKPKWLAIMNEAMGLPDEVYTTTPIGPLLREMLPAPTPSNDAGDGPDYGQVNSEPTAPVNYGAVNRGCIELIEAEIAEIESRSTRSLAEACRLNELWGQLNKLKEQTWTCRGCGERLVMANFVTTADGCPCNSPRGINHGMVPRDTCTCSICDPE